MQAIQNKKAFICDMDGVIYHGSKILDGVKEFVNWLIEKDKKFIFLTNSPERTPHELSMKLERMGLKVSPTLISEKLLSKSSEQTKNLLIAFRFFVVQ